MSKFALIIDSFKSCMDCPLALHKDTREPTIFCVPKRAGVKRNERGRHKNCPLATDIEVREEA